MQNVFSHSYTFLTPTPKESTVRIPDISLFSIFYLTCILKIQGAIMVSSLFQIVIGFTGLVGFLLRFIGPLTIAPTITLVGVALFKVAAGNAGTVEPRFTDTSLLRTISFVPGESPYIFSKFNPLNTDTRFSADKRHLFLAQSTDYHS